MLFSLRSMRHYWRQIRHAIVVLRRWSTPSYQRRTLKADQIHPWFYGLKTEKLTIPHTIAGHSLTGTRPFDLTPPILFLARGHSGTTPLARILADAGVYMGDPRDRYSLNETLDSLYWAYGFQRTLLPKLFQLGVGCLIDESTTSAVALECLRHHLDNYTGGPWGFKTCGAMFCHPLYNYVFPRAKYIYLVRDGRDVILSGNGYFHLAERTERRYTQHYWNNFMILTFGISNDADSCPFKFPTRPHPNDEVMRNRFWVQAKSWREHVRMIESLKDTGALSSQVFTIRYEQLCQDPVSVLQPLFEFLAIELTSEVKDSAAELLHTESIGRWKNYKRYVTDSEENMESVFASMGTELVLMNYV